MSISFKKGEVMVGICANIWISCDTFFSHNTCYISGFVVVICYINIVIRGRHGVVTLNRIANFISWCVYFTPFPPLFPFLLSPPISTLPSFSLLLRIITIKPWTRFYVTIFSRSMRVRAVMIYWRSGKFSEKKRNLFFICEKKENAFNLRGTVEEKLSLAHFYGPHFSLSLSLSLSLLAH